MKVLGVDEAGRGPVIGEMVIAGVLFDEKDVKKLEKMGIIKKYTIAVDFEKLNYIYAGLGITLKPGVPVEEIIEILKKDKDVKVIERGIGSHDIFLRVAVPKNLRELESKIHEIIMKIGEVEKVDKTIITEVVKYECICIKP